MIRQAVARTSTTVQLLAALLLAGVGLRFSITTITGAVESQDRRLQRTEEPKAAPSAERAPRVAPPAPRPKQKPDVFVKGESARVTLSVTAGQERSEVFVNGVFKGRSPYVGDLSCKVGEKLKIELIPPKGQVEKIERKCIPGNIRISDW